MNVIRTEALSPAWFEGLWLTGEQRIANAISELVRRVPVMSVAIVLLMAGQWIWLFHSPARTVFHFGSRVWLVGEVAFYLTLAFVIAQVFFKSLQEASMRSLVSLFIFAATLFVCWFQSFSRGTSDIIAGVVLTWVTIPLILFALHAIHRIGRVTLIVALALVFAIFPSVFAWWLGTPSILITPAWYLVWTDRLIIPFVVVLAELWQSGVINWFTVFDRNRLSLLFSPISFFFLLPLSNQDRVHERLYTTLLATAFLLFIRFVLIKVVNIPLENYLIAYAAKKPGWTWDVLWFGWLTYLDFFLFSYAGINFAIVMGRLLGLALEDGTHFALLAPTPLERWRRWNIYYYGWLFRFIFMPIFRKTRFWLFSIQVVFLVTFFLHASRLSTALVLPHFESKLVGLTLSQLAFFQVHGIAVFLSGYFPAWMQNSHSRWSWFGVMTTHFMMALIHIIPLRYM